MINKHWTIFYWISLLLLLTFVSFSAFYKIDSAPLWRDESRTLAVYCAQPFEVSNGDPPLYPFLLSVIKSFTSDLFWLRFLNAFCIVLATILMATSKWFNKNICWWAALAFASSYLVISRGQWLRPYALVSLLAILSYLYYSKYLLSKSNLYLWLNTFFNILILFTHYSGFIIVLNQLIFGLIYFGFLSKSKMRDCYSLFLGFSITLVFSLPWYAYLFLNKANFIIANGVQPPKNFNMALFGYHIIVKAFPRNNPEQIQIHSLIVLAILVIGFFLALFRKQYFSLLLHFSWFLSSAGFLCLCLYFDKISMNQRYYIIFIPALYLLVFNGIQQISDFLSKIIVFKYRLLAQITVFSFLSLYIFMPPIFKLISYYSSK